MHTKGPWKWTREYRDSIGDEAFSLIGEAGYGILSCDGAGNSPQMLGKSGQANARLIAAAPELLEALELAEAIIRPLVSAGDANLDVINEAIRKAKGD